MRLYLVPTSRVQEVRSPFARDLHYLTNMIVDARGRGIATARIPPLSRGRYALASWCPTCNPHHPLRSFRVQRSSAPRARLTLEPSATEDLCPSSSISSLRLRSGDDGYYGNGYLWARLPADATFRRPRTALEAGEVISLKMPWLAEGISGRLTVESERLDLPEPPRAVETVPGNGGSWAARLHYEGQGCWRITGRVADISLTFVVRIAAVE